MRIKIMTAIGAVVLVATLSSVALAHTRHPHAAPARHVHLAVTHPHTPSHPAAANLTASTSGDSQDQSGDSQTDEKQTDENQTDENSQGDTSPPASDNPTGT